MEQPFRRNYLQHALSVNDWLRVNDVHTAVVAPWGLAPDFTAPVGKDVVEEYRYMSDLNPAINRGCNVLPNVKESAWAQQHIDADHAMHLAKDAHLRENYAMTMDAVVASAGKVFFLEANCNPLLHPAFYPPMLDAIFKTENPPAGIALGS